MGGIEIGGFDMTKSKAEKAEPREKYIVRSGSFSRSENGKRVKYECGDEVELTVAEAARFPMKFLTLEEYEAIVAQHEAQRRADRALGKAMLPPRVIAKGKRSSEALKRQRKLLKIQHGNQARTIMG